DRERVQEHHDLVACARDASHSRDRERQLVVRRDRYGGPRSRGPGPPIAAALSCDKRAFGQCGSGVEFVLLVEDCLYVLEDRPASQPADPLYPASVSSAKVRPACEFSSLVDDVEQVRLLVSRLGEKWVHDYRPQRTGCPFVNEMSANVAGQAVTQRNR